MTMQAPTVKSRLKVPILIIGDIVIFYCALILMLFIRYGEIYLSGTAFSVHVAPFTIALPFWLLIFYIGGLYEKLIFKNSAILNKRFFSLTGIGALVLIVLFYFIPAFGIAPKVNLFIFTGIFAASGYAWRYSFNSLLRLRAGAKRVRVLLIGSNAAATEIKEYISANPQAGYELVPAKFSQSLRSQDIQMVVVPSHLQHDANALRLLYHNFLSGVEVMTVADFYEQLFDRVSIAELEDSWLITHLPRVARKYQTVKYISEIILALVLIIIASPLMILAALLIVVTSRGPILYKQARVGQNEEIFNLYKFRSMYATTDKNPDADANSPVWSTAGDSRITPIGKILRSTHIDELPQLFNILRGEMSFVGPRPERPEFTAKLEKEIPYYELRYLLKPGITGWAQINYQYGSSVEDAKQKLQYEIYYLKNRSLLLDFQIYMRTIKRFFVQA